jgi:hypothetical protein
MLSSQNAQKFNQCGELNNHPPPKRHLGTTKKIPQPIDINKLETITLAPSLAPEPQGLQFLPLS